MHNELSAQLHLRPAFNSTWERISRIWILTSTFGMRRGILGYKSNVTVCTSNKRTAEVAFGQVAWSFDNWEILPCGIPMNMKKVTRHACSTWDNSAKH